MAEGASASTPVSATDPDGDTITLSPTTLPGFASLDAPTSGAGSVSTTVTASPGAGDAAGSPYAAAIMATAGVTSDTENFQIIVTAGDHAPVLAAIGNKTIAEGDNTDYPISATDQDGDLITISATLPPFGALNAPTSGTGSVTTSFNLAPGFSAAGSYSGTVTATANGLVDSETFNIDVTDTNRPPTIPAIAPINVAEGASASTPVSASDPDGDLVTLSVVSLPAFAVLDPPLSGTGSVTSSITATPGFSDAGVYNGTIRAADPSNADATSDVSITVTNTDRGPALDPIANVIVGQGGSESRNVNASDPDGDVVELSATLPAFATLNPPLSGVGSVSTTISIDPTISTPTTDYPASVTATAILATDVENFTITVTPTNQVVVLDPIADVTLDEGNSSLRHRERHRRGQPADHADGFAPRLRHAPGADERDGFRHDGGFDQPRLRRLGRLPVVGHGDRRHPACRGAVHDHRQQRRPPGLARSDRGPQRGGGRVGLPLGERQRPG